MFSESEVEGIVGEALKMAYEMFRAKKHKQACVVLEQLLKVDPENSEAEKLYGVTLHALGRNDESVVVLEKCLLKSPDDPETLNNLAISHAALGDYRLAISRLERASAIKPDSELYLSNIGLQYRHMENFEMAIEYFQRSNQICEKPTTWAMMGGCHAELKDLNKAMRCTGRALEMDPQFAEAHVDMSSILHLMGRRREGFSEYEWRMKVYDQIRFWDDIYDPSLLWNGSSIEGKTILVHTEQGNGDTIQFCRFLPELMDRGARVVVHCSEAMAPILAPLCHHTYTADPAGIPKWRERLEGAESDVPDHDVHCFMMSLPHLLGIDQMSGRPYIGPYEGFNLGYDGMLKVGIAWGGNPQHPNDRKRSCRLANFRAMHDLEGVRLFSLMKDKRPRGYHNSKGIVDLAEGCEDMRIVDMGPHMTDYMSTAQIVGSLDMVVAVDTSVAHLAGAMGKETICLLSWSPDWRWTASGDKTDWYDSFTLLRQEAPQDWSAPFRRATEAVKQRRRGLTTTAH